MHLPHCPGCACREQTAEHGVVAALLDGDVDAAIECGLLDADPCLSCEPACRARVTAARDGRRAALAARERYRARQLRLERRAQERAARRPGATTPLSPAPDPAAASPALPPAAARALERARARALERRKP